MVVEKRKKPSFFRRDWYKRMRLGKKVKKKRIWRRAYGRHNKIRLGMKGYARKPSVGYGERKELREKINGMEFMRIENVKQIEKIDKKMGIIVGNVGKKNKDAILKIAKEKGINVLNKYGKKKVVKESIKDNSKKEKEVKSESKAKEAQNATK